MGPEAIMGPQKNRGRVVARKKPAPPPSSDGLLPGEEKDIRQEVASVVADPGGWLNEPNDQLGSERPTDLLGTEREQHVRDLLRAIKHGMPT
jgi:hypothetical protein